MDDKELTKIYSPLDKIIAGKETKLIDFLMEDARHLKGKTFSSE
nr:hypothetical protein Iba_chr03cCG8230 [Ipomoea batatas]